MDYKHSGVDIDAGNAAVKRIKELARTTFTPDVLSEIGSFGGLFRLDVARHRDPVLVASADGVGTKLKVAFLLGRHDSVGADLVNHCVNDILVQGARPLFFLDYLATGRLLPETAAAIVAGMARACRENGCALLGGETAEMPGFYAEGEYDLAGFIVGVVERERAHRGEGDPPRRRAHRHPFIRPAHERILACPAHRVRPAEADRGLVRPGAGRHDWRGAALDASLATCGSSSRCSTAAACSASRTSRAAASPTTCRGSCLPGPAPSSIATPGPCRRSSRSCSRRARCRSRTCTARSTWASASSRRAGVRT